MLLLILFSLWNKSIRKQVTKLAVCWVELDQMTSKGPSDLSYSMIIKYFNLRFLLSFELPSL